MASLVLTILMLVLFAVQPALAKDTLLVNRIGPSASELFVANGDGSGERKLFAETGFDYDASFSTDGIFIGCDPTEPGSNGSPVMRVSMTRRRSRPTAPNSYSSRPAIQDPPTSGF